MARRRAEVAKPDEGLSAPAEAGGAARVDLPADLGFAAARELHATLLPLRSAGRVVLDASRVERMSTAGVLVIVSFLNARPDFTPPAAVTGASGAFVDTFSELGLFASLMRMEFLT
jgi:anti-anti-sigma regulatory factor